MVGRIPLQIHVQKIANGYVIANMHMPDKEALKEFICELIDRDSGI